MNINKNFLNLKDSYLFADIARKVNEYKAANPTHDVIRLGIGDVTLPLVPAVIDAMHSAVSEMGVKETFRGYGEDQGYPFLCRAICHYYQQKGVTLDEKEIFISDGAKSDVANILDILSVDNSVLIPDPVYPVYLDTNIMAGRNIRYMSATLENQFLPMPDEKVKADIIYLCSPNNPTGSVYNREQLTKWVEYANACNAVILFDSAYEIFIQDKTLPTSIYEIPGAETCAIEFCSFSKTAGFTGTRCGYTVVPHALVRNDVHLNKLWLRRQTTKFNGVPYIVQRGAEAVFTTEGMKQIKENIAYYLQNAKIISDSIRDLGWDFCGGENAPYIWLKTPGGMSSWEFFDKMLTGPHVVGTPGAGFGANGEGFFRLSSFGDRENVIKAMERIKAHF